VEARASWLHTRFDDERPSAVDYSSANRVGGEVRGEMRGGTGAVTTIGVEGSQSHVASDLFGRHTQGEYGVYGASEAPVGPARTTTGVRIDYLAVDGGGLRAVVSPRLGAVLRAAGGAWRASAGRGFRAPSIAERFPETQAFGFTTAPNPSLDPETAWSFELGHQRILARRARLDAAVFWTEANDLIEPTLATIDDALRIQFRNISRARLVGLDLVFDATPLPALATSVAYQYLSANELATDTTPEQPLAFRPAHLATVSADYTWHGAITLGAELRYMSRFERVELFTEDPRVAMWVLDLRATYRRGPLRVVLLAANALNYIYNLAPRTLAPVRTVTATLTWTR
jgi:iron complex outermembrane receptor protein